MTRHIFLILLLTFALTGTVKPCDCKPELSVSDAVKKSDLVVSGKVIKTVLSRKLSQNKQYLDSLVQNNDKTLNRSTIVNEYTILVTRTYKGKTLSDTLILRTGLDPVTDCGLLLNLNQDYIFYLYVIQESTLYFDNAVNHIYSSSSCTRTRKFSKKEEKAILKVGSR